MMRPVLSLLLLSPAAALAAGPYAPAAGKTGTTALSKDDPSFVAWAAGWSEIHYGTNVDATFKTPAKALGPATSDVYDIVSLGDKGTITLWFPQPVADGPGADFAVFENSFSDTFLELAYVEVSSDGVNFFRFPSASLTTAKVGAFGTVDPTNLDGLAGKYRDGFGTPFDLAALEDSPLLDKGNVRLIRLVDIAGDGSEKDSVGRPIYDPYPTTGSGGFDLDAIGVIHQSANAGLRVLQARQQDDGRFLLEWQTDPAGRYRIEASGDLIQWTAVEEAIPGAPTADRLSRSFDVGADVRFWRIVRLTE